jgi:AcrR family transcriptional regulator
MSRNAKSIQPAESSRLGRDDWLDAAFAAVVEGGFEQVRVLALASRLGVTRGSFYWHFADHAELVSALLERWLKREQAGNAQVEAESDPDPGRDLEAVLDAALSHAGADLENMRFELALRGLGRRDAEVAQMLLSVDEQRLALFRAKFERLTGDRRRAVDLAALFYLAIIGSNQALSRPANPPQLKDYLRSVITRYLIAAQTGPASPPHATSPLAPPTAPPTAPPSVAPPAP